KYFPPDIGKTHQLFKQPGIVIGRKIDGIVSFVAHVQLTNLLTDNRGKYPIIISFEMKPIIDGSRGIVTHDKPPEHILLAGFWCLRIHRGSLVAEANAYLLPGTTCPGGYRLKIIKD